MVEENKNLNMETASSAGSSGYLQERRYLWTARVFAMFGAVSIFANIVLLMAVSNMVPLVRVQAFLFGFEEKSEQVIQIKPLQADMAKNDIVTESLVRYYILVRNTLINNVSAMEARWGSDGPIKWMSSDSNYRDFSNKSFSILDSIKKDGLTRVVIINSVVRLSDDIWQAEIVTRDILSGAAAPVETKWTVSMRIDYVENVRVKYSQRLKNPLGFVVQQYMIKRNN